jgi:hypothetical protein
MNLITLILGKDDKYWAGHFGVYMSGAEIRVRRESNPAEGDSYSDIPQVVLLDFALLNANTNILHNLRCEF